MSESWTSTRARIAHAKRQDPNADVSDLQAKLREQVAAAKIRKLAEGLNTDERQRVARILTEPLNSDGGSQ